MTKNVESFVFLLSYQQHTLIMSTRIPPPPNYESNTPSLASGDDKDSMYSTGNEQPFTQSIPYRDSKFSESTSTQFLSVQADSLINL